MKTLLTTHVGSLPWPPNVVHFSVRRECPQDHLGGLSDAAMVAAASETDVACDCGFDTVNFEIADANWIASATGTAQASGRL